MLIIANISLLVVALFDLCMMLRYDSQVLHQCEYKNSAYWQRLNDASEFTSLKRLLALAVLIGACTTMARMSWMVVAILAIVLLAQAIVLMRKPRVVNQGKSNKRRARLFIAATVLALVIVAIVGYVGSLKAELIAAQSAATTALLVLVVSPVLVVLSNWLMSPIERNANKGNN